ncbi:MAG: Beta-ketoacyl-acyl-carrier-protein synthase III [Bacteroidetes bacterium]|nr:MAG: Beta-ketoacyl-acyl-carrier-protein synthase III [Bacteroidota bacterium]
MIFSAFQNIQITGMSVAVPEKQIPVESFNEVFGEEAVTGFSEMTGVKALYRAVPQQTASDLGYEAARNLFNKQGINPDDIGILVFVTQKPDFRSPSTSYLLHKRLGLNRECSCFDINLACSGFIFGLEAVLSMLKNSESKTALLITGDTSVRTLSPMDRTMIMLFGDSGTATLLEKSSNPGTIYTAMRTDGSKFKSIITPSGAYRNMNAPVERELWDDGILRSDYDTHMKGMEVFGFSITEVPLLIKDFMEKLGTTTDTYDCFALHQANMFIIKQITRKVKIPVEKIPISIDRFGNNSSNSVPLVLADNFGNMDSGSIRTMMSGFGAGLSWGCADAVLDISRIYPIVHTDAWYQESFRGLV